MSKIKIAYIEVDTHGEIAKKIAEILHGSSKVSVDFYFSPKIAQYTPNLPHILVENPNLLPVILQKKTYDCIVIGTAHRYFQVWEKIVKHHKTAIIVHNLHFSKASIANIAMQTFKKDWKFRIKLWLKEKLWTSPYVYKKATRLFVLDKQLADEKNTFFLPITFVEKEEHTQKTPDNQITTIVIPGAVQQTRRDYGRVLDSIKYFRTPTHVVLLGKASGYELRAIENTIPFLPPHVKLTYFTERVSSDEYKAYLDKADVLWCPIKAETEFMSIPEYYGKTKISGGKLDAIRVRKPAIFPKTYPTDDITSFQEEKNIEQQIIRLKHTKIDFSEYEKEKVKRNLENIFQGLVAEK